MDSVQRIIYASRGQEFIDFISSLLRRLHLSLKIKRLLISGEYLKRFERAFTHESADKKHNYQFLEKIGDSTINKIIRFYIIKKFPELHNKEGVEFISELESKWKSTSTLSQMADKLGFKRFISADEDSIMKNIRCRSEDVIEAFIGALELNIDHILGPCEGYKYCFSFMASLLDTIPINYTYEQLINSKTRLNELFLGIKSGTLGLRYETNVEVGGDNGRVFHSKVIIGGKIMGKSQDINRLDPHYLKQIGVIYTEPYRKKIVAEKVAAEVAVYNLIRQSKQKQTNLTESVRKMNEKKMLNPFLKKIK